MDYPCERISIEIQHFLNALRQDEQGKGALGYANRQRHAIDVELKIAE